MMTLAAIDFSAERLKLFKLMVAILQPALVLALCVLFAIASVHLLTMLSTRWGNRRVSSKALLFSISLHVGLALGVLSLLPESQTQIWATLQSDGPVAISTTPEMGAERTLGTDAAQSLLQQLPTPNSTIFARTDRLPDPFEAQPDVARPEMAPAIPDSASLTYVPPQVEVTPEREAATQKVLEEFAEATLPEPELTEPEVRMEAATGAPQFTRSPQANADPQPVETERPATAGPDAIAESPVSMPEPKSLQLQVTEEPELNRGSDENVASRIGPIASPAAADPQIGSDIPEPPEPGAASSDAPIARVGTLRSQDPLAPEPAEVIRPKIVAGDPDEVSADRLMAGPNAQLAPERPTLARVEAQPGQMPAEFTLRAPELQPRAIEQFGGSPESQAAVDLSLKFLAAAQEEDGHWSVRRWDGGSHTKSPDNQPRDFSTIDLDVGVTALATLAFLGKGNSLTKGDYTENVQRSVNWLSSQQHSNGFIGREARNFRTNTVPGNMAGMYGHGMATFALAEAYAMSRDASEAVILRRRIELAVAFILAVQLDDGGWRYFQYQTQGGDVSLFGWQLMALKSAQIGGIPLPESVKEKMVDFLRANGRGDHGGLSAYRRGERVTPAMTAEALFCRQILGVHRDAESSREAVSYLLSPQSIPTRQRMDLYYWYYGMLAMKQFGDPEWSRWNVRVRDLLVAEQVRRGELAGSWEPRDPWSGYGGRIYSTAMATLCLEVYFRFLPMYEQIRSAPAPAEPAGR